MKESESVEAGGLFSTYRSWDIIRRLYILPLTFVLSCGFGTWTDGGQIFL